LHVIGPETVFSLSVRKATPTAFINGTAVTVRPKETLLHSALRSGIDFPHSCRVGSCTTCKCKLLQGKVKELTRASYVLTAEELAQGYILACQSIPQTDVHIEVKLAGTAFKRVSGRVTEQIRLTHDIAELRVQLEEALCYRAGQFADIAIAGLPGVQRSYSFAAPARPDAQVRFCVRKVPGGAFSSLVNDTDLTGQAMTVEGPKGDFYLRPAEAPLLFVAGGSGLAPILAMLQETAEAGVKRPVTLLFGARGQSDLYGLSSVGEIAKRWSGAFNFIPVLSDEPGDSRWRGERGLVTAMIPRVLEDDVHAYLCGPPRMVDSAIGLLSQHGVPIERIHVDRFAPSGGAPAAAEAPLANNRGETGEKNA
jgi:3-phenylpropionate/trans-cinnamate dioxygenase ferredoxin reductase subunit